MHRSGTRRDLLTLLAAAGCSITGIRPVRARSSAPTAAFSYRPRKPSIGTTVTLDGTESSAPDGSIDQYHWIVEHATGTTEYNTATPTHVWHKEGSFTVTLEITDDDGNTAQTSRDILISNLPPTAEFSYHPDVPIAGSRVTLNGVHSLDTDGRIESYDWTVEEHDGSTTYTGAQPTHIWTENGTYAVTLTVRDNGGETASTAQQIDVGNTPPTAEMSITPVNPRVGETVTLSSRDSQDPENNIRWREWSVDGTTLRGYETTYTFDEPGQYEIELRVTDSHGASDTTSTTITVRSAQPTVDLSYSPKSELTTETTITFDASASQDPDGEITRYEWSFPDDQTKTGPIVDHSFTAPGSQQVAIHVTDNHENTVTKQVHIEITPAKRSPFPLSWFSASSPFNTAKAAAVAGGLTLLSLGGGALLYRRRSDSPSRPGISARDADSQLAAARRAAQNGDLDQAESNYARLISQLEDTSAESATGFQDPEEISTNLTTARDERQEIGPHRELLDDLTEALSIATVQFQEATAVHATKSITVALAHYRNAAEAYNDALDILDKGPIRVFDEGYSITIRSNKPTIPESLEQWPNLSSEALRGLKSADLTSRNDIIKLTSTDLSELDQRQDVSQRLVYRLQAVQWWSEARELRYASRQDIKQQLERAKSGAALS